MKLDFVKNEKKIFINDHPVILPAPIRSATDCDGRAVILLDPWSSRRNVFCYSETGRFLWQIADNGFFTEEGDLWYDAIYRDGINRVGPWIASCRGRPFFLDVETGQVTFIPGFFEK